MLLQNKVAFVTGASRGIGSSIVKEFVLNGAIVYASVRNEVDSDKMLSSYSEEQRKCILPVCIDVRDNAAIKSVFMQIKKEQGKLDTLVNNAGIIHDALIGQVSNNTLKELFDINVFASVTTSQFASRLMARQGAGSIINLSSIVGIQGSSGQAAYSASKGAIISLTKSLAKEFAPQGIRVNAIAPGYIETDMLMTAPENFRQKYLSRIGMGRLGQPSDIAKVAVFFASDLSEYVTGQILAVEGGVD